MKGKEKKGGKGKKIVMAFGAFDGVHPGHLHYLKSARKLGNYLVVAIARDAANWKFPKRYNLPEGERKALIESLGIADKAVLGSQNDSLERILQIRPNVIALTAYNPVDPKLLEFELKEKGLEVKVVVIKPYKQELYSPLFGHSAKSETMGLPKKGKE